MVNYGMTTMASHSSCNSSNAAELLGHSDVCRVLHQAGEEFADVIAGDPRDPACRTSVSIEHVEFVMNRRARVYKNNN
jgi:hypothetical protein